jgi:hypothetical protein
MSSDIIEEVLKTDAKFFAKYSVLRDRFFDHEYSFTAAKFPGGNDHGPGHIRRVIEHLGQLVGADPIGTAVVNIYELYLAMMSVLYHDVGLLRGREGHAAYSGLLLGDDPNYYIFPDWDLKIIQAAVETHSSSTDIEERCAAFPNIFQVGPYSVRARVIAALVRLADELDEDSRRADKDLMEKANIPAESRFYWEFCQHISGIVADPSNLEIRVDAAFAPEDRLRLGSTGEDVGSFLLRFAEKLAKINHERIYVSTFLPERLRYKRLVVTVAPPIANWKWKQPRVFVFVESTSALDFVRAFPEMSREPAAEMLVEALEYIRKGELESAVSNLTKLEQLGAELPQEMILQTLYDRACVESLLAAKSEANAIQSAGHLDSAASYLKRWWTNGREGTWREVGRSSANEIFRMGHDGDLEFVLRHRHIQEMLDSDLRGYLQSEKSRKSEKARSTGGSGGCVLYGAHLETPNGLIPIQDLRVGSEIFSVDVQNGGKKLVTRILAIYASREPRCVRINGESVFTLSQPLCTNSGSYVNAGKVKIGATLRGTDLNVLNVTAVTLINAYNEVFTLTTDHPTHNFIVDKLICKNKMPWSPDFDKP